MPDDHRPAMLQVTAVDGQFGTHRDSSRVSAANTARSAQDSRGLCTWRRNTVISCRSTRISAFLDCALRASSPARPSPVGRSDTAVVPPRSTIMPNHHCPAMPQVTAMDRQVGTHTLAAMPQVTASGQPIRHPHAQSVHDSRGGGPGDAIRPPRAGRDLPEGEIESRTATVCDLARRTVLSTAAGYGHG
jgi:hypothetical protein